MRGLADVSIARPVFGSMIIVTLVVIGGASWLRLGVDRFPSVDLPTVSIRTTLPGASTEEVETEVSQRIEEAVNQAAGLDELRSISGPGSSVVIARFDLSRDIDAAAQDVRDRVATVLRQLPVDAEAPIISKFDNDTTPVLTLALTGDLPLRELTELAELRVKPLLERAGGVGQVEVVGGLARAVNVWLDAGRMAALGVSAAEVREALVRENAEVPGGNVTTATREASLRTLGRVRDPRELEGIVVARRGEAVVRLRDVGRVEDGTKEKRSFSRLDGLPNISLDVRRQSGANTIEVIDGVKARLEQARASLPAGARLEVIRDQSRYIHAALHEITTHLVMGSVLACLVVLLFMRSWRSTVIAGVAIPTSTVATFGVMAALGFTLNSVTMLALVLMVGVVIDDAIVVLENIFRWSEEKGVPPLEAAREGTAEIALAVLATTLSLAVIFVPVSFMSSISGRFLYQFGITSAAAVMVSLLVSFTLTPLMSSRLLRASDAAAGHVTGGSRRGLYGRLERAYLWLLERCMRRRLPVVLLALAVVAATPWIYGQVRQEYIPSDVDEAEFDVNVTAPEGTSIEAMEGVLAAVEAELRAVPHVRLVLSAAGGSFLGQVNTGRVYVRITPHEERLFSLPRLLRALAALDPGAAWRGNATQREVMGEVRRRLRRLDDLRCSVRNAPSFNIGGGNFDIDFAILGPDLVALGAYADELRRRADELGGIVDADTTLKLDRPELRVQVDRERAADRGVAVRDLATALRLMVGGDPTVSRWRDASVDEEYDVQLRLEARDREDPATIGRLLIPGARGLVRLDDLVTIEPAASPSRIDRLDRQRQVSLRASVGPGYALADRLDALRAAAAELGMPDEYTTRVQGRGRELERTFVEFLWAFLLSVILMYVVLASQFESLVHPFTILLSIPLSVPFALLALWGSGSTLNLYSALGILVLFGVVKKNAILQIDHMNVLRGHGLPRLEAVMQGNRDRLRPILMTTLTLVAGMLPLWVGAGPGAEERRAVAVVVIGGQTLALLLTLVVTPVAYTLLDDLGARLMRRR
ncbi:MAG: efflux RND transporter permease subunit [Planctomycetes bacterium]|nr:efflux RND transporter permease subunit [Planctomycetota bacterium]